MNWGIFLISFGVLSLLLMRLAEEDRVFAAMFWAAIIAAGTGMVFR